ncbi:MULTISPECIES: electron transfer flavoprotein subunit beta [Marinomonas]|uniref:Electron transfer flavoprotein subunit beta n=1 Tax=Marinomonas arctica TaxID=383750 RepID=A0A7H1J232_9GAMM|nr:MULTISPECIES: electron transfer flavoprotein subunit beta [Marinomonas]MCS7488207.1 electron transfer flavoprotein subunit beta [Marinomonas sp. BSi20414]QNT04548.1 electron transfer flavoprotein subunit beta [Marinomonas arctica]GGN36866.1 electron transfer flavoprotein subunit beta [Marinomonas arctica]
MQPNVNVISLVSVGRHPQSGRARRAEQDGRAVELGLKLAGKNLTVVHAGNPQEPVLRQYAGMGLSSLTVLEQAQGCDALPALVSFLTENSVNIVLTGVRSENGESSGMLPYLLADQLNWPLVPRVADIVSVSAESAEVLLALPRGQRRSVIVTLPFIASVDNAAQEARQTAFGPGLRADFHVLAMDTVVDEAAHQWKITAAKPRPKRLKVVKAKTAADRMKAATAKPVGSGGKIMKNETPEEKAKAIFDLLLEEKVVR